MDWYYLFKRPKHLNVLGKIRSFSQKMTENDYLHNSVSKIYLRSGKIHAKNQFYKSLARLCISKILTLKPEHIGARCFFWGWTGNLIFLWWIKIKNSGRESAREKKHFARALFFQITGRWLAELIGTYWRLTMATNVFLARF